jgi:predicted Zn-dependent protease
MFKHAHRPFLSFAIAFALLFAAPLSALARAAAAGNRPASSQDKKESKDKKDAAQKDEIKPKISKTERKYQEIKKFSSDLYNKDPEFRDEVEGAYRQKQREHSEYAYYINTRNNADKQVTRDGDKLTIEDTLYDNPMAQDYVNRLGQSLVPNATTRLYAFKITLNPIPEARSLSTGTVYISSGLLSQVDNEAQLAYILSHEIAHIEKDHWHEDVLVERGMEEYNEQQQKKRRRIGMLASIGLSAVGVSGGSAQGIAFFAEAFIMPNILKLAIPNAVIAWDKLQEDEADQLGLQFMLARSYDPREVPKFYAGLQQTSRRDRRAELGFIANLERIGERVLQINNTLSGLTMKEKMIVGSVDLGLGRLNDAAQAATAQSPADKGPDTGKSLDPARDAAGRAGAANKAITGALSAELQAKLDAGELIGSTAEFEAVMAELKRDNGVRAYYYDMFQMSRDNLEESLKIRSNDPYAHFYYGKVLKLTARSASEKTRALAEFRRAIDLDVRRVLPEARLHRALAMMENKDPQQMRDIVNSLKEYVGMYQREHGGALPDNMDVIYDYMQEAGELSWSASPAINVSTKNIDPITVAGGSNVPRPAPSTPNEPPASPTQPAGESKPQRGTRRP